MARRRSERILAAAVAAQLVAGVTSAVLLQPPHARAARPVLNRAANVRVDVQARSVAVRRLLAARALAVLHRDRRAFLATVDPTATAFLARQGRLLDALREVPLASWAYAIDASDVRPHTAALDRRRGTWWAPAVTLRFALAGFDRSPTTEKQGLTFVLRGTHWYVGAYDDFATTGHPTTRDLWDEGPVLAQRGARCLVLSHSESAALGRQLVRDCDAAVPRVTAVWGRSWVQRVVVVVPDSPEELTRMVPDAGDLRQIAAVATAELDAPATGYHPVGDRILVNPATYTQLGALGERVVMTHEVTHVASRSATGVQVPTWMVEGLADYVGYQGLRIPLALSAQELQADVRAGKVPRALPADGAFDGSRSDLAQVYEQSWLAVVLLARTYGQSALLRLYREVGADGRTGALDRALHRGLDTSLRDFTALWRADLRHRLS